jgi:peptidoglycan/xylan/chitin deacetylase (PgdA/CDA1 family)
MKWIVKEALGFVIRYSGAAFLVREVYARNKVSIVLYHDPNPVVLNKHLAYLLERYTPIKLEVLIRAIYARDWSGVPAKALVITLDDGLKGNFELLNVFRRYRVVPTIYLCSQIVNSNRRFWFKTLPARSATEAKQYSNGQRNVWLRRQYGFENCKEYPPDERLALNLNEINLMKNFVDFQSHTRFHPILTTCSDTECKEEIKGSKEEIERLTGNDCCHFAYPNGDYTLREIEYLKQAGYKSARTIDVGWNSVNSNPYALKITGIGDDDSINVLVGKTSGIIPYLNYLLEGSFSGKHPTIRPNRL